MIKTTSPNNKSCASRIKNNSCLLRTCCACRIESWFEAFVHFQTNFADTIDATSFFLEQEFKYLKVNWQINNLWLLDSDFNALLSTNDITPDYVKSDATEVIQQQASTSYIRCIEECQQLISMPILINETDVVVLSISSSLLDAMATLNQTTFAELAIVSMPINAQKNTKISELLIRSPISVANKRFMQHILQQVPAELSVATLKQFGFRLTTPTTDLLLNLLPVEVIKIDRSFVSGMQDDNADMKIVSSTIAMVNKLGMMVVAEGIETAEQMKMLTDMQCDIGQGYFISKPVNEKDLYALLPTKVSHGIWTNISLTDD
jgi:hypothetical protein